MFTFWAQATTCSKHHTQTVIYPSVHHVGGIGSANPSDSWALVSV